METVSSALQSEGGLESPLLPVRFVVSLWLSTVVVIALSFLGFAGLAVYYQDLAAWVKSSQSQLQLGRVALELLDDSATKEYLISTVEWLQEILAALAQNQVAIIPAVVGGLLLGLLNDVMWKLHASRQLRAAIPSAVAAALRHASTAKGKGVKA